MIYMIGYVKDTQEVGAALSCYCFRCSCTSVWEHWKVREWLTFFTVKIVPVISRSHVVCGRCREPITLDGARRRMLRSTDKWPRLAEYLEDLQLSKKSEVQRTYLLAKREQSRSRD